MKYVIDWVWNDMPVWLAGSLLVLFGLALLAFLSTARARK